MRVSDRSLCVPSAVMRPRARTITGTQWTDCRSAIGTEPRVSVVFPRLVTTYVLDPAGTTRDCLYHRTDTGDTVVRENLGHRGPCVVHRRTTCDYPTVTYAPLLSHYCATLTLHSTSSLQRQRVLQLGLLAVGTAAGVSPSLLTVSTHCRRRQRSGRLRRTAHPRPAVPRSGAVSDSVAAARALGPRL